MTAGSYPMEGAGTMPGGGRGKGTEGDFSPFSPSSKKISRRAWTWRELCVLWDHSEWTADEVAELLPGRSRKSVERARDRYGRSRAGRVPTCARCEERPVWVESAHARRLGLCKGCYVEEEERRLGEQRRSDALRQRRMASRRRGTEGRA